jgi:hypothetical protein
MSTIVVSAEAAVDPKATYVLLHAILIETEFIEIHEDCLRPSK